MAEDNGVLEPGNSPRPGPEVVERGIDRHPPQLNDRYINPHVGIIVVACSNPTGGFLSDVLEYFKKGSYANSKNLNTHRAKDKPRIERLRNDLYMLLEFTVTHIISHG